MAWATAASCPYAFLAVGVIWHIWTGHPTTETIGGADSSMDSWSPAFVAHAVVHGRNPSFTVHGNWPFHPPGRHRGLVRAALWPLSRFSRRW